MYPPANYFCTHDDVDYDPVEMVLTEFDFYSIDGDSCEEDE
jgi:hypothetical protein